MCNPAASIESGVSRRASLSLSRSLDDVSHPADYLKSASHGGVSSFRNSGEDVVGAWDAVFNLDDLSTNNLKSAQLGSGDGLRL